MNKETHIVEMTLGSIGRLKILRALAATGFPSYTKYGLEKTTGLKPAAVREHLKILVEAGLVKELALTPKVYVIEDKEPFMNLLIDLFRKTGYAQ